MKKEINNKINLTLDIKYGWTVRSVILSIVVTGAMYFSLPYLEMISQSPQKDISIRSIDIAELPPATPPPPKRRQPNEVEVKPKTPKPKLQQVQKRLPLLQANLNLSTAIGDVGGDFAVDFGVSSAEQANAEFSDQIQKMIFELGELDEPPGVLARVSPIYPNQAKMRKLNGKVVLEFVIGIDGSVKDIKVISSQPGAVFNDAAIQCIKRWRFSPGTKDGKLVASRVQQAILFTLD